jgi:uncharacterized protein YecT (DUF1311 family)
MPLLLGAPLCHPFKQSVIFGNAEKAAHRFTARLDFSMAQRAVLVIWLLALAQIHGQTQRQMNAMARADFAKADLDLNKTYQTVLAKLPTAEKQKLQQAQRAWVALRDLEAARAAKEAEGGSMAPTLRYQTMTDLTQKRITELKVMMNTGTASTPQMETSPLENKQASSDSQAEPSPRPTGDSLSPDKKWEYKPANEDRGPQIVKAGTNETAGDLSDDCGIGSCGEGASVLWAPDSKRFAFNWGQGRTHQTSFYQLRDDRWESVKPAPDDEASSRLDKEIAAQLRQKGQSEEKLSKEGLYLRLIWQDVKVDRWIDSNTALLYASDRHIIARRDDPGEMSDGFGADLLFTLKFDDAGKWKIVKTHEMSEKEVEQQEKER